MKILKFGGTSVGSAERMRHVADLISSRGCNMVVLSAMSGTTNTLVEIAEYLQKGNQQRNEYLHIRSHDLLLTTPLIPQHRQHRH